MKEKTKDWIRIICSILMFNIPLLITILIFKLFSWYSLGAKILIDVVIIFAVDKSIKRVKGSLRNGSFSIER